MKVKMCLFPLYITYITYPSSINSPKMVEFLEDEGVEIEEYRWNGTLDDIPTDELVIIRYSSRVTFSTKELTDFLSKKGLEHFVFYEDAVLLQNGDWSSQLLLPKFQEFLKKKRSPQQQLIEANDAIEKLVNEILRQQFGFAPA